MINPIRPSSLLITILNISLLALFSVTLQADTTEDFEDGDLNGWTTAGTVTINTSKAIGTYSMRLKGGATAERAFPQGGDVTVALAATSLENNNYCDVFVSADGVNWGQAVVHLANGQDNGIFSFGNTTIAGSTTHIRYVQTGSAADYCYADGISIAGTANPAPVASVAGNGNFGSIQTGNTASSSLTVSNTGNADLLVGVLGGISPPFTVVNDTCSNATVTPGNNCTADVQFSPTTTGSFSDNLSIPNNDTALSVALSGTGSSEPPPPTGNLHSFSGDGNVPRANLTLAQLNGSSLSLMDYSNYSHGEPEINADASHALQPTNTFEGRLVLNGGSNTPLNFDETTSGRAQAGNYVSPDILPGFDFEFVQTGSHIIPKTRGLVVTGHGDWNYILEPGRVWNENNDSGYSRVAIPFALQEVQANCTHNGIMTFLFKDDGSITNVAVQVGGETCLYFQYNLWGLINASYISTAVADKATLISNYESEVANRLPAKPIAEIETDFPGVIAANIAAEQSSNPTTHGVLYNGVHYAAPCSTRNGDYPYCEVMALPSYSTAKTAAANFAHALLTQQQGSNARNASVSANVTECQDGINGTSSIWSDVTVENALDMATGNYRLASYSGDEDSSNTLNNFFLKFTHAEKMSFACERYIRKAQPNNHFSYHSSDTYIAGVALDNFYGSGDLYEKLVNDVYKPLNLSPATYTTVRTQGSPAHPFWSHGLTWHADDMIKLGQLINDRGVIDGQQVLDGAIMDDMLLKGTDPGLETYGSESTYLNGVWTYDMGQRSTALCSTGSWVTYMSGYGGIGVVMFPNGAVYYYVSDSGSFAFGGAEAELHKISNICGN